MPPDLTAMCAVTSDSVAAQPIPALGFAYFRAAGAGWNGSHCWIIVGNWQTSLTATWTARFLGAQVTPIRLHSAAKSAIEGLSGSLHGALAPLGISVTSGGARRIPNRFRRTFADTVDHGDRRLRRHRGHAPQECRHGPRHSDRRPSQSRHRDHRGGAISRVAVVPAAGIRRAHQLSTVADARAAEIDKWEELTTSTDFDSWPGQNGNRTHVLSLAS